MRGTGLYFIAAPRTAALARTFQDPPSERPAGPRGACGRPRSRVRTDWEAERACTLGPLAAPERSPALGYLGSEGRGLPAERARGRSIGSPETWTLLGAQRSPDTRALHLARLVGAPTLPIPPAIPLPRGAGREGRGGRRRSRGQGAPLPSGGPHLTTDQPPTLDSV